MKGNGGSNESSGDEGPGDGSVPFPAVTYGTDRQLSENIPGMGSFWLRSNSLQGEPRSTLAGMASGDKDDLVKVAYDVAQAVCDTFCPGDRQELMDAVTDSHKTYRRKFEKRMASMRGGGARKKRRLSSEDAKAGGGGWVNQPDTSTTNATSTTPGGLTRSSSGSIKGVEGPRRSTSDSSAGSSHAETHHQPPPPPRLRSAYPVPFQRLPYGKDERERWEAHPYRDQLSMPSHPVSSSSSPLSSSLHGGFAYQDLDEGVALSGLMRLSDRSSSLESRSTPFTRPTVSTPYLPPSQPPPQHASSSPPIPYEALVLSRIMYTTNSRSGNGGGYANSMASSDNTSSNPPSDTRKM